jgi:putative endonuclease
MCRTNQSLGKLGEGMAEKFFRSRGFSVMHKNYATPFGEIDMVVERDGCIVFAEVKTRISERFGHPLDSITETKKRHILKNCLYFLKRRGLCETPCRIDAVSILLDEKGALQVLKHIRNAIEM